MRKDRNSSKIRWEGLWVALVAAGLLLGAGPGARADARHAQAPRAQAEPARVINLNTATESDLEALPGIGPSKAKAILDLRAKVGRFRRVEDILRVHGIGRATFRKLRPMLTVGPAKSK